MTSPKESPRELSRELRASSAPNIQLLQQEQQQQQLTFTQPDDSSSGGSGSGSEQLPPGWEAKFDTVNKRVFFVDHNTKTTTWERPKWSPAAAGDGGQPIELSAAWHAISSTTIKARRGALLHAYNPDKPCILLLGFRSFSALPWTAHDVSIVDALSVSEQLARCTPAVHITAHLAAFPAGDRVEHDGAQELHCLQLPTRSTAAEHQQLVAFPIAVLTQDCLTPAPAAAGGRKPRLALLHLFNTSSSSSSTAAAAAVQPAAHQLHVSTG
jgi:hypothetical protein